MNNKNKYIQLIDSNIKKCGYHIYAIKDLGPLPRFEYSIGLKKELGFELILAGALLYTDKEVKTILDEIIVKLKENKSLNRVTVSLGTFSLRNVDTTWIKELMLGALDYYDIDTIKTLQILPEEEYFTIDIPDLSKKYSPENEPVWKWLTEDWIYDIPSSSICAVDLDALRGKVIVEAVRWDDDYWEISSDESNELVEENSRFISLGIILESDSSNKIIGTLSINEGASRIGTSDKWEIWGISN